MIADGITSALPVGNQHNPLLQIIERKIMFPTQVIEKKNTFYSQYIFSQGGGVML
jgi:hypothetical protein